MAAKKCRHVIWEEIEGTLMARCANCRAIVAPISEVEIVKPKPRPRRRPSDSERLTWLLHWIRRGYDLDELYSNPTRLVVDRLGRKWHMGYLR